MKTMAAGKFKAQCLAVMDEVQAKREPVVLTKHGKPVAKLVPMELERNDDWLKGFRFPGLKIVGDIMEPMHSAEEWEAFADRTARQIAGEDV